MAGWLGFFSKATHGRLHALALFFASLMPLWLVIGRAWADIAVVITCALFVLHVMISRDIAWLKKREFQLLLIFWGYLVAEHLLVIQLPSSLYFALLFARFIVFYIALRIWVFAEVPALRVVSFVALPLLAFAALGTYWQYATGTSLIGRPITGHNLDRLTGPLSHPNIGNYMYKMVLPMVAIAFIVWRDWCRKHKLGVSIASVLLLLVIPLSGERSVTIMLVVVLGSAAVLALLRYQHRRYIAYIIVVLGMIIVALGTQPVIVGRGTLFLENLKHFWSSVYGQLFQASFMLTDAHPLFGIGAQQFYQSCKPLLDMQRITYCDIHPHNFYLQWLVETGALGLGLMLLFLGFLAFKALRVYRHASQAELPAICVALGALAGLLFPFVITQSNFANWSAAIFWYALALLMSLISVVGKEHQDG